MRSSLKTLANKIHKAERKKIIYSTKTPDKEFEYQNMKVNELYHLIKQQDKSKLGALQLIPSFEVIHEPRIRKKLNLTILDNIIPTEKFK